MAARKKKRELSEKAQKRIRQRNLHVGITVIAAIVIIFSVIQFTLWRYVSKVDEEHICKNVFIGKTDVSGMTKEEAVKAVGITVCGAGSEDRVCRFHRSRKNNHYQSDQPFL